MDALVPQVLEEGRILDAVNAVTDARRMKGTQCFPYALWTACFTRVSGTGKVAVCRVLIGRDVGSERETSLVACQIQSGDTRSAKAFDQLRRLEALFRREVTERAEDEPGFDASSSTKVPCGVSPR